MKVGVGQRMMKECILAMMLQHIKLFRPAYRVLTRIEPGLTLWPSLHIQSGHKCRRLRRTDAAAAVGAG